MTSWSRPASVSVCAPSRSPTADSQKTVSAQRKPFRDFRVDLATSERLSALMPEDMTRVAESGIRTRGDLDRLRAARFDAFPVGESLLRQVDRTAAVGKLVYG